ncbi:hypothetical protein [Kineococcus glutinatus]|uniref:hypothetical protein n=1 Tax=Kineococcus glutinatus TaxID=1070872 RepID=UPI0031EFA2DC
MAGGDELGTYLDGHFTGAVAGLELFRRAAAARRGQPSGEVLARLAAEVAEDRAALRALMSAVGATPNRPRAAAAWVGERASRLVTGGRSLGRSPLRDYLELEALLLGVQGKEAGWRTLRALAEHDGRLDAAALDELVLRAQRQAAELVELRARALERSFAV